MRQAAGLSESVAARRLQVDDLHFAYPGSDAATPVLRGVSVSLAGGELFGLLGPNGAGKTTFITLLAGLLKPAQGQIHIAGYDLLADPLGARARLGLVFQSISLDRFMTVEENLRFAGGLQGLSRGALGARLQVLVDTLPLAALMKRKVLSLSGGQQRMVDIARAMIHTPALLVLDEPTHGLDVVARAQVWSALDALRKQPHGPAVLVSTHLMDEAADCDRVCFLQHGSLIWTGTPQAALDQLPAQTPVPVLPARSLAQWFVWRAQQ